MENDLLVLLSGEQVEEGRGLVTQGFDGRKPLTGIASPSLPFISSH